VQVTLILAVVGTLSSFILQFPRGSRASNLEITITGYEFATLIHRQTFPNVWAENQNNLGIAYCERILGNKAENLEAAIRCFKAALEIYTQQNFPEKWADIQNNLALAYFYRILREKAENLEIAICSYQRAFKIYTCQVFPEKWADIQNDLGIAYRERIRENRAENLEAAIRCFKSSLEIRTHQAFPQKWADTQNNLGNVYLYRILGKKTENLEEAIKYYLAALKVYTREVSSEQWAIIQNNLGTTYFYRILGKKIENFEKAIKYYLASLKVYTLEKFPEQWATIQKHLGIVYREYIIQKQKPKPETVEEAIRCFLAALSVLTREVFPNDYAEIQFNLGRVYQYDQQFYKAYHAFTAAIDIVESLRNEIIYGSGREEDKKKLAEKYNLIYQAMIQVCLTLNKTTEAIEYVERSKTRNLVELILSRDLHSIFSPDVVKQLEQLRDEIATGQYQLQTATAENPTALAKHLEQLRLQRNELQDHYLPIGSGFQFAPFQATLDEHTAIVEFYITNEHLITFIVTRQTQKPIVWQSERQNLENWANAYLEDYSTPKNEWQEQLTSRLEQLAKILDVEKILKTLSELSTEYKQLILIPHRYLHLFPLHALPVTEQNCFLDYFPKGVRYAPSIQLLQLAQKRERPNFSDFFAVQNPTNDLSYAEFEVAAIISHFSSNQVLVKEQATKQALTANGDDDLYLSLAHCVHFACHGEFNFESPLESALKLANEERLTLADIFGLSLNQCRLVTLSACETGLTDPTSISDEYIGLPSGFLYAGCANVVSSLWTVNQVSTAFLMIKFYKNLKKNQISVAKALNDAQRWLRDATLQKLLDWITQLNLNEDVMKQLKDGMDELEEFYYLDEKPYNDPYYWAAFCAIGQ